MTRSKQTTLDGLARRTALAAVLATGSMLAVAAGGEHLSGADEVPPVDTSASGTANVTITNEGSVSGNVMTQGIDGNAAHIHHGAKGMNGPPIIKLSQEPGGMWMVPAGSKLSNEQLRQYKAGELYVNVHSAEHKDGEIRAQLNP